MRDGEFRVRDGLLAGYYLVFMTANWFLLGWFGPQGGTAIAVVAGLLSATVVLLIQADRASEARFNRFVFGAFLLLIFSVLAVDLLIAGRFF